MHLNGRHKVNAGRAQLYVINHKWLNVNSQSKLHVDQFSLFTLDFALQKANKV